MACWLNLENIHRMDTHRYTITQALFVVVVVEEKLPNGGEKKNFHVDIYFASFVYMCFFFLNKDTHTHVC